MSLRHIDPEDLHPVPNTLSHAVVIPESGLIYLSGQIAWNAAGELIGKNDYAQQAEQISRNIDIALSAAGTDRSRVVKETIYIVDCRPEIIFSIVDALRKGATAPPPAQTIVGVAALAVPGYLLEVDIVATL